MSNRNFLHANVQVLRLGPQSFLLYDAARDLRHRCGMPERWLLERLDRNEGAEEILRGFQQKFGRRLLRRDLESFVRHMQDLKLTDAPPEDHVPIADPAPPPAPLTREDRGAGLNHTFDWLVVAFGWLLHPFWLIPLAATSAIALVGYVQNIEGVVLHVAALFRESYAGTIVLLFAIRAVASLPRELLVGMACRKYNGRVEHFGLHWWYRIVPYFQCRVAGPPGGERGQWTLITIGLWFHLAFFAVSALGWMMERPPSVLSNLLLLATLVGGFGFLFRLNPFEQSNGYGILCYRLKQSRLLPRALAETKAWLFLERSPEPLSREERFWFRWYGLGVYLTRALIVLLIGLLLWYRFEGPGIAAVAVIVWIWHRELTKKPDTAPRVPA